MKKKKAAPVKDGLLSSIAREMGSAAGTIVNTTRALAVSASAMVEKGKGKPSKKSKAASKKKATRKVAPAKKKRAKTSRG